MFRRDRFQQGVFPPRLSAELMVFADAGEAWERMEEAKCPGESLGREVTH